MGNAKSQLKIPMVAQLKPVRFTSTSIVSSHPTSLSVELTGMNTTFRIFDANNGGLVHDIQPTEASSRRTICSANGVPLLTIKSKAKENAYCVYDGTDESAEPLFRIVATRKIGFPLVVYAEFSDHMSATTAGETCRVLMEGDENDRVVVAYLERGAQLTPIQKEKNCRNPASVAVARIRRPKTDGLVFEGREKAFIEAEAGVDLTLLAMIWYVRYEIYYNSMIKHGGSTFNKMFVLDDNMVGQNDPYLKK